MTARRQTELAEINSPPGVWWSGLASLGNSFALVALLAAAVQIRAQEITLKAGTKEVVVPFAAFDQNRSVAACPAAAELTVKENGMIVPIRGIQSLDNEPIALAIVVSIDGSSGFNSQEDTQLAFTLARDLLTGADQCVAVNATGDWDRGLGRLPKTRQSGIKKGRAACLELLEDLADRLWLWRDQGAVTGSVGYTWAGVSVALKELARDPSPRQAVVIFGTGVDSEEPKLPRDLGRKAQAQAIPVYSIYLGPEDPKDPKILARYARLARKPVPWPRHPVIERDIEIGLQGLTELTRITGGRLYKVDERSALAAAKEIVTTLRRQCLLTYSPPDLEKPGWRKVEVTIDKPGWKVRHRPSYYADRDGSARNSKP